MRRELENAVILMLAGGVTYDAAMRSFERLFIVKTLERHKGCQCHAAAEMGMHRNTLRRKIAELAIDPKPWLLKQASDDYERGEIGRDAEGAA